MRPTTSAFQGTPGTKGAFRAVVGCLVVIDRAEDVWERTGDFTRGSDRWAIQHEPSREYTTAKSKSAARAEAERLARLSRTDLFNEMRSWTQGE